MAMPDQRDGAQGRGDRPLLPPWGDTPPCGLEEPSLVQGRGAAASAHAAIQEAWDKKHPPWGAKRYYIHTCMYPHSVSDPFPM